MSSTSNALYVLAFLSAMVVVSEWMSKKRWGKHFGTALIVIILTAVAANLSLIPSASNSIPLYDGIFSYVAPIALFYLLLGVNLSDLKKAGLPMLVIFSIGALGTTVGVLIGIKVVDGAKTIGDSYNVIAGMFAGTYTGGSINFNAVALHYRVMEDGRLYAGTVVVDNIITTIWMVLCIVLPKIFNKVKRQISIQPSTQPLPPTNHGPGSASLNAKTIALLIGLGLGSLWLSNLIADYFEAFNITIPSILIITTIALLLAQVPYFRNINGSQLLGLYGVYLFLAVIGAYCELTTLVELQTLGITLLVFTSITVLVHGLITFGLGALFYQDWELISIASQANIGGSTSAMALAESFGRMELILPAILIGSLGNAIGTYIGFLVAGIL